jgi:hypothetical protein
MSFTQKLSAAPESGFSMALYGRAGAWKTGLMRTMPSAKTLYIEIEGGATVLKGYCDPAHRMPAKPSKEHCGAFKADMDGILNELRFTDHNIEYVIVDSATEIEKYLQLGLCYASGKDITSLKEYGGASDLMYKYIVELRDLKFPENNTVGRPINTIFICAETPIEVTRTESTTITMTYPLLTKKMAIKIAHMLDILAHLEVKSDQMRYLRVCPTDVIAAKSRYPGLARNVDNIGENFPFFEKVVKPILADVKAGKVQTETAAQPDAVSATKNGRRTGKL